MPGSGLLDLISDCQIGGAPAKHMRTLSSFKADTCFSGAGRTSTGRQLLQAFTPAPSTTSAVQAAEAAAASIKAGNISAALAAVTAVAGIAGSPAEAPSPAALAPRPALTLSVPNTITVRPQTPVQAGHVKSRLTGWLLQPTADEASHCCWMALDTADVSCSSGTISHCE